VICFLRRVLPVLCIAIAPALTPFAAAQDARAWTKEMNDAIEALGSSNYAAAEQLYLKALKETETFGPKDARRGSTLNSIGLVYRSEKKFSEAEAAFRRALPIMQAAYGDGLDVANIDFNIAGVLFDEGHAAEALPALQAAHAIYDKFLPPNSPKIGSLICLEGDARRALKQYEQAEALLRRCSDIREADSGVASNELADAQYSLALAFMAEGKFSAAEPRLRLVEKIREKTLGITSPVLAQTMEEHATVLRQLGHDKEAARLSTFAAAIRHTQPK
jgi:tetratricopeptide (TPR) repeat protein